MFSGISHPVASGREGGAPERTKILQAGEPGLQHRCPALWRPSTSLQALLRQTPEEVSTSALFTYSNTRRGDLGFLVKLGWSILHQERLAFSFLVCFKSNQLMLSNTTTVSRKLQGYSLTHIPPKLCQNISFGEDRIKVIFGLGHSSQQHEQPHRPYQRRKANGRREEQSKIGTRTHSAYKNSSWHNTFQVYWNNSSPMASEKSLI